MWGEAYLPQTKILPLVDAAIIHGGCNSLMESIACATPVIIMPIFFEQLDNAQRVQEKGYGIRIEPYNFEDSHLVDAIESILSNGQLKEKYRQMAARIRESNSKVKACIEIEAVVDRFCRRKQHCSNNILS